MRREKDGKVREGERDKRKDRVSEIQTAYNRKERRAEPQTEKKREADRQLDRDRNIIMLYAAL